ncbi:BQ5605_C011g06337 [Microbotryum silenes-dioicae]|uniref:BQ5605_C011g06337 protein n=1 Tax=Microbotryum silenes-dioicae TaxID=796604 RepID=A0A2X0MHQ7_9BASI|nr:BQ5605_C011g06337 [Microbotryum silenes-dioicae]
MSAETFLAAGAHTVVAHALLSGDPEAYLAKHEPLYWTSTTKTWRQRARTPQNGRSSALDPPIPEASYVTIPGMDRPVQHYNFSEIPRDKKGALRILQEIFVTGATNFLQFDGFNLIPFSALGGILVDTITEEDCNSDWVDSQAAPPVATAPLPNAQVTSSAASDLAAVQAAIARASQDKRKEKGWPLEQRPTDTQPPGLSMPKPPPVKDNVESNIAKVLSAPPKTDYAIELCRHINVMEPDPSDEPSWSVALCKVQTQIVLSKEKKRSDPARLDSMALLLISKLDAAID